MNLDPLLASLEGGLIVSCQAAPGSPTDFPEILAAFARCADEAGAAGIRANHGPNIEAISNAVRLPIIGIKKREVPGFEVYITPEWQDVIEAANAGAKIIALDATARPRPGRETFGDLAKRIHDELGLLVMADVSTVSEGTKAREDGADMVATTMSGYTSYTSDRFDLGPDLELVESLAKKLDCPVICEGRISTPSQAGSALNAGAFAVVVGTAITAPTWIAEQFIREMRRPT
jgi:N-acylglucosamine-6-phosphate 2-epimerase